MKKRSILVMSLVLALSIFLTACGGGGTTTPAANGSGSPETNGSTEKPIVFKLGHQAPAGTLADILAHSFKDKVEEGTEGRYQIDIYPGGSLGGDRELIEGTQVGNIHFTALVASDIGLFLPELEVQDLPYLFEDWDQVWKFLDSDIAKEFYELSDEIGIKTLAYMPRGFRHITTTEKPIYSPDDIKGLKMRVSESQVFVDTFNAFGANAQAMAWGEVFTALQQGTVDGHENTIVTIKDYKIDEVQNYLSKTGHMFGFIALTANTELFEDLPAEDQEVIRQAAVDACLEIGLTQEEAEAVMGAELEAGGMVFNEVDKQAFIDLVEPVYEKFFQTHDRYWFDSIKEAVK